jgi:bifunctional enzyme CysN/CysC
MNRLFVSNSSKAQAGKDLLRFITCGSVDDGKSTLIGRLLYDCRLLPVDQLASLERHSRQYGTTAAGELDFALLVDGLAAEREQGITIDVAYRFFATDRRQFIVADTPGHEQYTRNMATGASTADAAVLLVDARKGLTVQTRRHSHIVWLMGLRQVVLAVNKMDLVGWSQDVFQKIADDYTAFAGRLGLEQVVCVPVSALAGDNVANPSAAMPWYSGPTVLAQLESIEALERTTDGAFRLPVQWVNRPNQDFRGFAGTVVGGPVAVGDRVVVLPGGQTTAVRRIVTMDGDLDRALADQAVTLVLADEIDVSRGDMIAAVDRPPVVADQFAAHVVWMTEQPLLPGRSYLLRLGTAALNARITDLKHAVDVDTLGRRAAKQLVLNEIGVCNVSLDRPVPFDAYTENRATGGFVLIDRLSNATVGCGMVMFPLRRASNIQWRAMKVDKAARAQLIRQKPCVLWLTGLSGAGKSTIADVVEQALHHRGHCTMTLDGDNVRHGLNRDLGFTDADRVENVRRVGEVAKLMVDAGLIVLVSFISPFRTERQMARGLLDAGEFFEIFVDAPLAVCEMRDPKGLYRKARSGQLPNLTGIGSPYEPPEAPELHLHTGEETLDQSVDRVLKMLEERGII